MRKFLIVYYYATFGGDTGFANIAKEAEKKTLEQVCEWESEIGTFTGYNTVEIVNVVELES